MNIYIQNFKAIFQISKSGEISDFNKISNRLYEISRELQTPWVSPMAYGLFTEQWHNGETLLPAPNLNLHSAWTRNRNITWHGLNLGGQDLVQFPRTLSSYDIKNVTVTLLLALSCTTVSCTTVVVHYRDRPCICINPNRTHTLTPPKGSSSTT